MSGLRYSWSRTEDGWAVKASGNLGQATGRSGETVQVIAASGKATTVTLGRQIDAWNGGRAAVYAVPPRPRNRSRSYR
jgi:hypothetical protein